MQDTAHGAIQFDHKGKQAEALKCGAQRSDAELGSTFFCGLSLQSESEDDQKGFQHEILYHKYKIEQTSRLKMRLQQSFTELHLELKYSLKTGLWSTSDRTDHVLVNLRFCPSKSLPWFIFFGSSKQNPSRCGCLDTWYECSLVAPQSKDMKSSGVKWGLNILNAEHH